jgi:predicted  nucleic acid-binding Zn-ribbon protein
MTGPSQNVSILQQLLDLQAVDLEISSAEQELNQFVDTLATAEDGVVSLESRVEQIGSEVERARGDARTMERAVDDKRDVMDQLRTKVNKVQNEKQYGAATLEFDLARQEIRQLEDRALEKLQAVEELEGRQNALQAELDVARSEAEPLREATEVRRQQLQEELAIKRDKRENLAMRIDKPAMGVYDRIRSGRSLVALAPLSDGMCGHCFTSVTIQQEMQIKGMSILINCEGCGVILYPDELKI